MHVENFKTLQIAFTNGDVALAESRRKSDGAKIAVICMVSTDDSGDAILVPVAQMFERNPYDEFIEPHKVDEFDKIRNSNLN